MTNCHENVSVGSPSSLALGASMKHFRAGRNRGLGTVRRLPCRLDPTALTGMLDARAFPQRCVPYATAPFLRSSPTSASE